MAPTAIAIDALLSFRYAPEILRCPSDTFHVTYVPLLVPFDYFIDYVKCT